MKSLGVLRGVCWRDGRSRCGFRTICRWGRVLTHRQILHSFWGPTHTRDGHNVRVHMGHLRQKPEPEAAQPRYIHTETRVGYRLVHPSAIEAASGPD